MTDAKNDYGQLLETAYRKYQLDWMLSHGFSLTDLKSEITSCMAEVLSDEDCRPEGGPQDRAESLMDDALDMFLNSQGFGSGSIFACRDEFEDNEFMDRYYMKHLLCPSEFKEWETLTGNAQTGKNTYYVRYHFNARFTAEVKNDNDFDRDEIIKKADESYIEADFGEAEDIDGEAAVIENENGNYLWEK